MEGRWQKWQIGKDHCMVFEDHQMEAVSDLLLEVLPAFSDEATLVTTRNFDAGMTMRVADSEVCTIAMKEKGKIGLRWSKFADRILPLTNVEETLKKKLCDTVHSCD